MSNSETLYASVESFQKNVGIAFALVIASGLSTCLGACIVFFPTLIQLANKSTLAISLGFSAGVMAYVSFVEILQKSYLSFLRSGMTRQRAYQWSTLCFFGGVLIMVALNHLVEAIMNRERTRRQKTFLKMDKKTESDNTQISIKCDAKEKSHHNQDPVAINSETKNTSLLQQQKQQSPSRQSKSDISEEIVIDNSNLPTLPLTNHSAFATQTTFDTWNFDVNVCCSTHDPVKNLENLHTMAKKLEMDLERKAYEDSTKRVVIQQQDQEIMSTTISSKQYSENNPGLEEDIAMKNIVENDIENMSNEFNITLQQNDITNDQTCDKDITLEQIEQHEANETQNDIETKKIMQMSINTTIAIALHNFPEGLATFVATLNDPKVGAVLAFAIAIHNIPEGICVSLPLYYATGNRRQAFLYGALSGVSEPIAAVIGFAILANAISDVMYAILFGIVAGMMVIISIRELLPTAHRYDPEDHVVTNSFILGMSIMALSLVFLVK